MVFQSIVKHFSFNWKRPYLLIYIFIRKYNARNLGQNQHSSFMRYSRVTGIRVTIVFWFMSSVFLYKSMTRFELQHLYKICFAENPMLIPVFEITCLWRVASFGNISWIMPDSEISILKVIKRENFFGFTMVIFMFVYKPFLKRSARFDAGAIFDNFSH